MTTTWHAFSGPKTASETGISTPPTPRTGFESAGVLLAAASALVGVNVRGGVEMQIDINGRSRTSRACDRCRGKRQRCDSFKPACRHCASVGQLCTYLIEPKKRGPPRGYRFNRKPEGEDGGEEGREGRRKMSSGSQEEDENVRETKADKKRAKRGSPAAPTHGPTTVNATTTATTASPHPLASDLSHLADPAAAIASIPIFAHLPPNPPPRPLPPPGFGTGHLPHPHQQAWQYGWQSQPPGAWQYGGLAGGMAGQYSPHRAAHHQPYQPYTPYPPRPYMTGPRYHQPLGGQFGPGHSGLLGHHAPVHIPSAPPPILGGHFSPPREYDQSQSGKAVFRPLCETIGWGKHAGGMDATYSSHGAMPPVSVLGLTQGTTG